MHSMTKINAYVIGKSGETLFYGYPSAKKLRMEQNRLLGVWSFILE